MKIVHVLNNGAIGTRGIEKQVVNLAMAQKARGSDVMIIADNNDVFIETCGQYKIPVVVMARGLRAGRFPDANAVQGLIAKFRSLDVGLIHCHTVLAATQAIAAGNRMGVPCVFTAEGSELVIIGRKLGLRFAVIYLTDDSFKKMQASMPGTDIYYIPNGTRVIPITSAKKTRPADPPSLIFVGQLITRKGLDTAILAMAELRRRHGQNIPVLNVYGDGDQRAYLAEMTALLELNDIVSFHGFKAGVLEHCSSTDILVMTSRGEVGPLVVLEAMSRGMPIVATDVGEVSKMLPSQEYGYVVPPDCIAALADAIESLLADVANGKFDPNLPIERHRTLYSAEKMAERIEALYHSLDLKDARGVTN